MEESTIEELVRKGHFAFQEYATLNWIQHAKCPIKDKVVAAKIRDSAALLYSRDVVPVPDHSLDFETNKSQDDKITLSATLNHFQDAFESVDNISSSENEQG